MKKRDFNFFIIRLSRFFKNLKADNSSCFIWGKWLLSFFILKIVV